MQLVWFNFPLGRSVCVLQQWLLLVLGRGLDSFFFFDIFDHFSFYLTLFSLSTQGNWHAAGQFHFFFRREGLFQQSCSRFLGERKSHFFLPLAFISLINVLSMFLLFFWFILGLVLPHFFLRIGWSSPLDFSLKLVGLYPSISS